MILKRNILSISRQTSQSNRSVIVKKEDFSKSTTGKVVQTSIHLTPYWAFVPNPLPPSINPSWKLVNLLSEADREIGIVAGLARNIPDASMLIEPFMRREAVLSSRIEGTHTALSELYGYEAGHFLPGFSRSNEVLLENQEVLNYVKALKVGLERIKTEPINLALIKDLHRILLYGVRGDEFTLGEFREIQNFIGRSNDPSEAIFIPTPVADLSAAVRRFEEYILTENQYPPLIRIAMIHYQFETIHPFLDGNGRVGRLLIVLLLVAWRLLPEPLLYPSSYFEQNREH
ncbi:Fic family protein, partial [bacterium]|nr:Fic family protein [bacterium]